MDDTVKPASAFYRSHTMNRILAALILSTAAIGAAQAGELGYLDNPSTHSQSTMSRAQVQDELNAERADVQAFQGQLDPSLNDSTGGHETRAQVVQEQRYVKASNAAGAAFVNG
jgi:hypothetical protein